MLRSIGETESASAQGLRHNVRVAADPTSAAHPARNAGHASFTLSLVQPGSAVHATGKYFAGNEGGAGTAGAGGDTTAGGTGGAVTQPAIVANTAAASAARRVIERRGPDAMGWFLLEALFALVIAVAIVAWTMGPKRRKPPRGSPNDTGNGSPR